MPKMFRILILTLIVACSFGLAANPKSRSGSKKSVCKHLAERVDNDVGKVLTVGHPGSKFPITREQVPKYCSEVMRHLRQVENYTKTCLDSTTKQVASVLIFTMQSQLRQLCAKDSKRRRELLETAECANKASSELQKCNVRIIDNYLGIMNADHKLKIPLVCCEYFKLRQCIVKVLKPFELCTEKRIDIMLRFLDAIFGNANALLCRDYDEESDKCKPLVVPKKRPDQRRPKSYFTPLLQIMASIPDQ